MSGPASSRSAQARTCSTSRTSSCPNIWLPLGSLVYLLFCTSRCGWGWKNFKEEANEGGGLKVKDNIRFYVSYILPIIVLIIFGTRH